MKRCFQNIILRTKENQYSSIRISGKRKQFEKNKVKNSKLFVVTYIKCLKKYIINE